MMDAARGEDRRALDPSEPLVSPDRQVADRYSLRAKLGEGASGTVFAAWDQRLEREVAIKLLRASASDPRAAERFMREARATAALDHPAIVRVHDLGTTEDGAPFVVMERLKGETLAERIARRGTLPLDEVIAIATALLDALHAAHEAGILHRDVKPANVMLARTAGGEGVKLLDFGLARFLEASATRLTAEGTLVGSPAYVAPERLRGAEADARSDVYSAGVTLYEALAGVPPFQAHSPLALRARILVDRVKPLAALRADIPVAIAELVECGMAREPGHRFTSARAFRDALLAAHPLHLASAMSDVRSTASSSHGLEPHEASDEVPPSTIAGHYRVVREIGAGGMGRVYEAVHEELARKVAIKVVRASAGVGAIHFARLEREARAAARLGHPNIVSVFDFGVADGGPYLVMELLRGESLAARIHRSGALPADSVLRIALQILDGLAAAHEAGMVHRDIKPANLYLVPLASGDDLAKLLDFGIVKLREESAAPKLTTAGVVLGTPTHMAPEQLRMQPVDARADVYSMGATLYEALTGELPYTGESPLHVAQKILEGPPPMLAMRAPGVPDALAAVVERAMSSDPSERYPNAAAMRDALAAIEGSAMSAPSAPRTAAIDTAPPRATTSALRLPTHRARWWALAIALAAIVAALAVWLGAESAEEAARPTDASSRPVSSPSSEARAPRRSDPAVVASPTPSPPRDPPSVVVDDPPAGVEPPPVAREPIAPAPVVRPTAPIERVSRPARSEPRRATSRPPRDRRATEPEADPGIMNPFD